MTAASGTWPRGHVFMTPRAAVRRPRSAAASVGLTAHARPPPGVSNTLLAVVVLGCLLAVLLVIRGEQILANLVTGWT